MATLELHIKCSNIKFSFTCMIGTLNVSYEIYCNHILTLQPRQVNEQNSFLNTVRKPQDHHMTFTWPSHGHHMTITWPSQDNHWQLYSCHVRRFHDLQYILLDTHYNTHHKTPADYHLCVQVSTPQWHVEELPLLLFIHRSPYYYTTLMSNCEALSIYNLIDTLLYITYVQYVYMYVITR